MKPCDCKDSVDTKKLDVQGLCLNEWSILVKPTGVYISNSTTELRIPMNRFKQFTEWYLTDQAQQKDAADPYSKVKSRRYCEHCDIWVDIGHRCFGG